MNIVKGIRAFSAAVRGRQTGTLRQAQGERDRFDGGFARGIGDVWGGGSGGWAQTSYGEYYPRSAIVYAAIKVRQDAIARLPLRVMRRGSISRTRQADVLRQAQDERFWGAQGERNEYGGGRNSFHPHPNLPPSRGKGQEGPNFSPSRGKGLYSSLPPLDARPCFRQGQALRGNDELEEGEGIRGRAGGEPVGAEHPLQRLLDSPNPFWSRGGLWRATETYLSLWGAAFWGLERDENGGIAEIWPLRPDKMRVIPDTERYIRGFVYMGAGSELVPYLPDDVVWMRYFNPLDEYAGLSPIAPLRQSADMGMDALRANRKLLQNDSTPGLIIELGGVPTDEEVSEFYARWESRFQGVDKTRRPALLSPGMKASNLGFSPRDMEYIESLRWSLEDVSRVFGVPKVMIGDLENTTFSNFSTARRLFWEDTVTAQLAFYTEAPHFGDDSLTLEFDLSGVEALKESEENKAKRRNIYVKAGIMTVDEVRREMNLPPLGV